MHSTPPCSCGCLRVDWPSLSINEICRGYQTADEISPDPSGSWIYVLLVICACSLVEAVVRSGGWARAPSFFYLTSPTNASLPSCKLHLPREPHQYPHPNRHRHHTALRDRQHGEQVNLPGSTPRRPRYGEESARVGHLQLARRNLYLSDLQHRRYTTSTCRLGLAHLHYSLAAAQAGHLSETSTADAHTTTTCNRSLGLL